MAELYLGTSGWHYDHWRGHFYPPGLPKTEWLAFYAKTFRTVEVNYSFYRLPPEKALAAWRDSTPAGFRFAVKTSRLITHMKKLSDVSGLLDNFLARANMLRDKLGPLLYQLPPNLQPNEELLESFLRTLPAGLKHVFEFRHTSWHKPAIFDLLRRYGAGFCVFDMPGLSTPFEVTSGFAYLRFHGSASMYGGDYPDAELQTWVERIASGTERAGEIYIYFNNDAEGFAVKNALTLGRMLRDRTGITA